MLHREPLDRFDRCVPMLHIVKVQLHEKSVQRHPAAVPVFVTDDDQ